MNALNNINNSELSRYMNIMVDSLNHTPSTKESVNQISDSSLSANQI
jgi:hypothetical protein